jgi:hypothetical protein
MLSPQQENRHGIRSRRHSDGSLTITISHTQPKDAIARANWLPAPEGQFALLVRAYVPTQPVLDGRYKLPNVERVSAEKLH